MVILDGPVFSGPSISPIAAFERAGVARAAYLEPEKVFNAHFWMQRGFFTVEVRFLCIGIVLKRIRAHPYVFFRRNAL